MRERSDSLVYAAIVFIALFPSALLADAFRCGNYLIREGMPAAEIKEKCGPPDSVRTVSEPIMATRPNGTTFQVGVTTTEYWTYGRGPQHFPARLTIEKGIAKKIELLSQN